MVERTATAGQTDAADGATGAVPLVVDLDGTLLKTDLLYEALFLLLGADPPAVLRAVAALPGGKAAFKARLADAAVLDLHRLPVDEEVLDLVRRARAQGRPVWLASASDTRWVEAFAEHTGLFDGVLASDGRNNLGGHAKAQALVAAFGEGGFDYVGNDPVDVPVWAKARVAWVADPRPGLVAAAGRVAGEVRTLSPRPRSARHYLRAMRVHQWLKNLLIFVPGIAAHVTDPLAYAKGLLAFLAFGLCASGVYLLNDLLDLGSDRAHATKRNRPFAAGILPLVDGFRLCPLLLLAALALALAVSPAFLAVLAAYYVMTLGYSLRIKRVLMLDVVVLAGLYGVRVVAGAAAFAVPLSEWLIALCIFLFLSLALVKRVAELAARLAQGRGDPEGRAYRLADLPLLEMLATASGLVAVLVLALYINSPDVVRLYALPQALWAGCLVLLYWLGRILILTHRGVMHDDPVVFAVTDRVSLLCGGFLGLIVLVAALGGGA